MQTFVTLFICLLFYSDSSYHHSYFLMTIIHYQYQSVKLNAINQFISLQFQFYIKTCTYGNSI